MATENELNEKMRQENGLLWRRYSVMLLAHSLLLRLFIDINDNRIRFLLAVGGLIFTYFWWSLTTIGWELAKFWGRSNKEWISHMENESPPHWNLYEYWLEAKYRRILGQDMFWWAAHGVIWLFLGGYLIIGAWLSTKMDIPYLNIGSFLIITGLITFIVAILVLPNETLPILKAPEPAKKFAQEHFTDEKDHVIIFVDREGQVMKESELGVGVLEKDSTEQALDSISLMNPDDSPFEAQNFGKVFYNSGSLENSDGVLFLSDKIVPVSEGRSEVIMQGDSEVESSSDID